MKSKPIETLIFLGSVSFLILDTYLYFTDPTFEPNIYKFMLNVVLISWSSSELVNEVLR